MTQEAHKSGRRPVHDLRILPMHKGKESYDLPGKCANCGFRATLRIPKGDRAPRQGFGDRPAYCPQCGVRDLAVDGAF